jgi:predicted urease superfamily metal-dependent hydrolase
MNTLNTIINSISQNINESVIDGLTSVGYDHTEATKLVVEDNFSIVQDALENPVEDF